MPIPPCKPTRGRAGVFVRWLALMAILCAGIADAAPLYPAKLIQALPHDRALFTQGLLVDEDEFIESSGLYGLSQVIRYAVGETPPRVRASLSKELFAEGAALHGEEIFLLTWREKTLLTLDRRTLKPIKRQRYPNEWGISEGWGLASDGESLIVSDGTDRLLFVDAKTLHVKKTLRVTDDGLPVRDLNELEYARGVLLANIWYRDEIAAIDPISGRVLFWLNLAPLRAHLEKGAEVANGIAWDAPKGRLYVTGKYWDKMFLIATPHRLPGEKR